MTARALLVLALACKNEPADRAAHRVLDQQAELRTIKDRQDRAAADVAAADRDFTTQRAARIAGLRARHALTEAQAHLIAVFAQVLPLTDIGRAALVERLHVLHVRLDETANQIEALSRTEPDLWRQRDDQVRGAMARLDDARAAAWKALGDASRAERSS